MVVDRIIHPLFSSTREQWVIDERKCFNQIMLYLKNAFQKELWEVLGKFIFMKYTLFIQPKIGSHGSPDYIYKKVKVSKKIQYMSGITITVIRMQTRAMMMTINVAGVKGKC